MSADWLQLEGSTVNGVYRLERLLGATESSAVYRASRKEEPRPCAIKLLVAREDAARVLARWERASQVSHPHLIGIAGIGRAVLGGREMLFAAMECADDVLADALAARPLAPAEVKDLVGPCLEALAHLHSRGLAHGRLAPSNVLAVADVLKLSADNVVRFGEELPAGADAPPDAAASPASDVWSLGGLISAAFHAVEPPEPFAEVVRGCRAADPKERWTLHAVRQHLNPAALRPARGARAVRFAVIGGLVTALVAAVLIVPRFQSEPPVEPASPPPEEAKLPVPVQSPPPPAPSAPPEPRTRTEPRAGRKSPEPEPQRADRKAREPEPPPAAEPAASTPSDTEAVVSRAMPDVAPESLRTVSGKIRVSVGVVVNESGGVTGTSLESAGPSRYFAAQAERAAARWKFVPGAAGRWLVRFEFTSSGVTASARRAR